MSTEEEYDADAFEKSRDAFEKSRLDRVKKALTELLELAGMDLNSEEYVSNFKYGDIYQLGRVILGFLADFDR